MKSFKSDLSVIAKAFRFITSLSLLIVQFHTAVWSYSSDTDFITVSPTTKGDDGTEYFQNTSEFYIALKPASALWDITAFNATFNFKDGSTTRVNFDLGHAAVYLYTFQGLGGGKKKIRDLMSLTFEANITTSSGYLSQQKTIYGIRHSLEVESDGSAIIVVDGQDNTVPYTYTGLKGTPIQLYAKDINPFTGTFFEKWIVSPIENFPGFSSNSNGITFNFNSDSTAKVVYGKDAPPTITVHPANQYVKIGQAATFSVTAIANPAPTYQWRKNGVNISGATSASYTQLITTFEDDEASYSCLVSNSRGSVSSLGGILYISGVPLITVQPVSQSVSVGNPATFSISANGNPAPNYLWRKNGIPIYDPGGQSSTYTIPKTSLADNGAKYSCEVSNWRGYVISNEVILTVNDTQAPSAPTGLHAFNQTQNRLDLGWSAASDNVAVVKYNVYRNNAFLKESTSLIATDSGLFANTQYSYKVTAVDAAGNESLASNVITPTTLPVPDTQAPSAPNNLRTAAITQTQIDLGWNASIDNVAVVKYKVYRNNVFLKESTSLMAIDSGLSPNTSYSYKVTAVDAAGNESAASNVLDVKTQVDATAPSAPSSLRTTVVTHTSIYLAWNASTDNVEVVKYKVYKNNTFLNESTTLTTVDWGLTPNTQNSYKVTAVDGSGNESAASNVITPTTLSVPDTQAPSFPGNLRATAISQTQIDLAWNASIDNVGVVKYKVYRNNTFLKESTTLTAIDSGLSANTSYSYKVIALDAADNESLVSNVLWVTTLEAPDTTAPLAPINVRTPAVQVNQVVLAWNASFDGESAVRYRIVRDGFVIGETELLLFADTNVAPNSVYRYKVRAVNAADLSADSEEIAVKTPSVGSGVELEDDNSGSGEFKTFVAVVNPNAGPMLIEYDSLPGQSVEIKIYDRSGRLVRELSDINSYTKWDGRNSDGEMVALDTYLVYLKIDGKVSKRTVAIVK